MEKSPGFTLLLTIAAAAAMWLASAAPAQDSRQEVRDYLARNALGDAEMARLDAGQVVTAVAEGQRSNEVFVVAAVKIGVPRARVTSYYGQMIAYVDGEVTLAFGRFGSPPVLADVKDLAFDPDEVDQLKSCRPGKCDIRLSGAGLDRLRSSIDWSAADYVDRANAFARKAAVDYVAAYQARGDAALVTYNDRAQPVSLEAQWRGILANSPLFHQYSPDLKAYLERFPKGSLASGRDIFYWVKEVYGRKPVISLVHGVVYDPPTQVDRTIVAQKLLYASHYLDGSLAVATLLDTRDGGRPATYLVYVNRSRGDMLQGGFGGLKRNAAKVQARKAAEDTLGSIKHVLESVPQ
jgi:hypothetical protein